MKATYLSYRMAQIVSQLLPRRFAYWLGLRIADRFYARDPAGRRAVMANFRRILKAQGIQASEETLGQMARENFQYFGKYLVDFFKFSRLTLRDVKRMVSIEHFDYVKEAESYGRGVLVISAHLGNWELAAAVFACICRPIHAVVQPMLGSKINELFQKHRNQRGMNVIPMGRAARGVIMALREKQHVAMVADRDFTAHNETMLFFGEPARLPSGPARVAFKTGAPLVPCFLLRQPDDTFLFRFYPPILPADARSVDDIRGRIRDVIEKEIGQNPLQWFMFDDFWKWRDQP